MSSQLDAWQGSFGQEYTDRNIVDPATRLPGFQDLLAGLEVKSILEVGCNRGHNLLALRELGYTVAGVEPMPYARTQARRERLNVFTGSAYQTPFPDRSFDLVFTSGVLIHIPPDRLLEALAELTRVTRRYLLAIEYHSDTDEEILYRGQGGMLWRRDYTSLLGRLHGFTGIRSGPAPAGFEGATFTICERSG